MKLARTVRTTQVESGVLSPGGNLQSTCEDFEGVSDLKD